jgi:glycosyltransferase involved in cell wall biosynthesis
VCGPFDKEKEFVKMFSKELFDTPNIHAIGWVDVNGPEFFEVANNCIGIVYPSCSEGQAGSVIISMHAGLVPLVSYETGVDVDGCGMVFKDLSVPTIQETVRTVSWLPADSLQQMARQAWERARARHTRESYAGEFRKTILAIMKLHSIEPSPPISPSPTDRPLSLAV